jgi:hypothetical protein
MKRTFFVAATVSTTLASAIALAATVQQNLPITVTPSLPQSGGGGGDPTAGLLPSDRDAYGNWKMAGLLSTGGIATVDAARTTCATVQPSGVKPPASGDDANNINNAISSCSAGQILNLAAGTFVLDPSESINLNKGLTLRGAGAGKTMVEYPTNNPPPGLSSYACPPPSNIGAGYMCSQGQAFYPLIRVTTFAKNTGQSWSPCALTADSTVGGNSISVTSGCVGNFHAGDFVLLDENVNPQWMPDTESFTGASGFAQWSSDDYRVTWLFHNPPQSGLEDGGQTKITACIGATSACNTAGTNLYVTSGSSLTTGTTISGAGVAPGTYVTGGSSPYTLAGPAQAVTSEAMVGIEGAVNCNYTINCNHMSNEIKQVVNVGTACPGGTTTTVCFDSPTMFDYRVSHYATLYHPATPFLQEAGVENMSLRYGASDAIQFYNCAYCWASGNNIAYDGTDIVAIWSSFRTELLGNYIHECQWPEPGEACYQIDMKYDTSESLIWNNISVLANKVIAVQSAGAGSVVAYNYLDKGYIEGQCCWQEIGANASHLTGSHHVLFEGNLAYNMDSDDTHGASGYMTYFRNWSTAARGVFRGATGGGNGSAIVFSTFNDAANTCGNTAYSGSPLRAAGAMAHSYWFSYIGNFLGTPGCTVSPFPLTNHWNGSYNSDGIYFLGWYNGATGLNDPITSTIYPATPPQISCYPSGTNCASGFATASCTTYGSNCATILLGNYDTVTGAQEWWSNGSGCTSASFQANTCSGGSAQTLPNSLFLSSAPSWWPAGYAWPWFDPSQGSSYTTSAYDKLPARSRYDSNNCSTAVFQNNADCEPF